MRKLFALVPMLLAGWANAQTITSGPLVGGVTHDESRIYLRTAQPRPFELEYSTDSLFAAFATVADSTRYDRYGSRIVELTGLQPSTTYFYRVRFGGGAPDQRSGRFRTFPVPGTAGYCKIVVGSCNYNENFPVFAQIRAHQPDLVLHLGDWNWPPAQFGNDMMLHPDRRAASFAARYEDNNFRQFVNPYFPVDYVYDDDFSFNDGEGWTYPTTSVNVVNNEPFTTLGTVAMPAGIREGAIRAYAEHFPGYPLEDSTQGIFHRIQLGNVELFMLDTRNNRGARHDQFYYDSTANFWTYSPAPGHTMLGVPQREWLMDGLTQSSADWKLIGSSVVFNRSYERIFRVGMQQLQQIAFPFGGSVMSGTVLGSQMSYNWVGFPEDHRPFLDAAAAGLLPNTAVLSGDSHSSVLDDGTNAGLPEMNASGWASNDEGYLNYYVDYYGALLGQPTVIDSMWNHGGNGVGNQNFTDTYGVIEVFGRDSMRLCIYDELAQQLACMTLLHSSLTGSEQVPATVRPTDYLFRLLYPNPAKDRLRIVLHPELVPEAGDRLVFADLSGRTVRTLGAAELAQGPLEVSLDGLPAGTYVVSYEGVSRRESRQFLIAR
jgi:alkaline phosphatase D